MTSDFVDMMHLFSCGALNKLPDTQRQYNIYRILELSSQQNVFPFVFLAIKSLHDSGVNLLNEDEYKYLNNQYMSSVYANVHKNAAVNSALIYLEDNGVKCCILKGAVLANLYSVPDARVSGDTDVLLERADMEQKACSLLKEKGYSVIDRPRKSHHAMCTNAVAGLIELHLSMYDEIFEDIWFTRIVYNTEPYRIITTHEGYKYTTLGVTDGAIFVSLHAIKHFLSAGLGIRQLADVLLYNENYADSIDWVRYRNLMKELKFDKLLDHFCEIGNRYLGFNCTVLGNIDEQSLLDIADDIENGGIFGKQDKSRKEFYKSSSKKRYEKQNKKGYDKYIKQWQGNISSKSKIFPSYDYMKKRHTILERKKFLLPFLWSVRLCVIFIHKLKRRNNISDDKRIETLKRLDII